MNLSVPSAVKRCSVGIWLLFLYIFCVNLVVFSLSTCLFQLKLNSLLKQGTINGSPLIEHYCDTSTIKDDPAQGPFRMVPCIPTSAVVKEAYYTSAEILLYYNKMKSLKTEYRNKVFPELQKANMRIAKLNQEIENTDDDQTKEKYKNQQDLLLENIKRSEIAINSFKEETKDPLSSIFIEIDHFEKFFKYISWILGGVEYYWAFPQPILKIILVLSMGILGSLIFVTIEFIKEPRGLLLQRFNMYFFRPFLGMIVALAMYVMVKSGLSSIADSNNSGDLSPFLISFLGIVSGMLSEQAYKRIETTGNKMLADNTNKKEKIDKQQAGD
ncbi:MAG: hypothetical protein ACI8ZB_004180 [Desulforhopalus sp.]|jgi:hypothetical protein